MAKLVLEKAWEWNDKILMYFDHQRPDMVNFPFWWYHIEGREIRLIKQVSKTFGVVFSENRWIPEVEEVEILVNSLDSYYQDHDLDSDTLSEIERRSWSTLGQYVIDDYPNELLIEYASGGGVIFKFHPTTKKILEVTKCNSDGIIIYHCKVDFEEITTKETGQKKIIKSRSSIFDIRAFYRCESEKGNWVTDHNGKKSRPWVFRELIDQKWVLKEYKK